MTTLERHQWVCSEAKHNYSVGMHILLTRGVSSVTKDLAVKGTILLKHVSLLDDPKPRPMHSVIRDMIKFGAK